MVTRRKTKRSTVPSAPVAPEDVAMKKARKLPMFGPGIVINVPLALLPAYMETYRLRAMTRGEVHSVEQKITKLKGPGVVWVRREAGKQTGQSLIAYSFFMLFVVMLVIVLIKVLG